MFSCIFPASHIVPLCEQFDMYIGNFGSNKAKGKIKNAVTIL